MRRELKIVQGSQQVDQILDYLSLNTSLRKHHPSQFVNSLYFDDLWLNDALDNLSGLSNRKKIRLRWYADQDDIDRFSNLRLEIKYKKSFLSCKQVFDVEKPILSNSIVYDQLKEYAIYTLNNNNKIVPLLRPVLQVQYFRDYYIIDNNIRITVDTKIRFLDAIMTKKPQKTSSKDFEQSVLEIKFNPNLHESVSSIVKDLKVSPSRNSKYLRGLSLCGHIKYL